MKHIILKNGDVIAVCKDKDVADMYVQFVEENEKEKQRKSIAEGSQLFCWNYCNDYYVKSILDDNDILRIIEEASFEKDGQENKVSNIFDKFGKSGIMIYQKLEKE